MKFLKSSLVASAIAAFAIGGVAFTSAPAQAGYCDEGRPVVCSAPNFQPSGFVAWHPGQQYFKLVSHGPNIVVFYKVQGQPWRYNTNDGKTERDVYKSFPKGKDLDFYACAYKGDPVKNKSACDGSVDSHT